MIIRGRFVEHGQGFWSMRFDEPYTAVGELLDADVRRDGDRYRYAMLDVLKGLKPFDEVHGNAYVVYVTQDWVLIEYSFDETERPTVLSRDAFLAVLKYWKTLWAAHEKGTALNLPEFNYSELPEIANLSPKVARHDFFAMSQELNDSESSN